MYRISCFCKGHESIWGTGSLGPLDLNLGTVWNGLVSFTPRPLSIRERYPVSIVREVDSLPGPVWTGAENLASDRNLIPGPSSVCRVAIPTIAPAYTLHTYFICVYKVLFLFDQFESKIIAPKSCSVDLVYQILSKFNE